MDWENHLEKNPVQKIEKPVKIRVKLPHVNKKPLSRNRIFVQTPFSHSTLKLERKHFTHQKSLTSKIMKNMKRFTPQKPLALSFHFLFRRDQNHYSNLTSKTMKMCEQSLKKHSRKNSWNDSKDKIYHTYDWTTRTTFVNTEPPQMS